MKKDYKAYCSYWFENWFYMVFGHSVSHFLQYFSDIITLRSRKCHIDIFDRFNMKDLEIATKLLKQLKGDDEWWWGIKQLTPSEALLLKSSKILTDTTPICQIRYQKKSSFDNYSHYNLASNHIIRDLNEGVTAFKYYIPSLKNIPIRDLQIMMDNFIRLSLLDMPTSRVAVNKDSYADFYKDEFNTKLEVMYSHSNEDLWKDYELAHILSIITPMDFGRSFYKVCVE